MKFGFFIALFFLISCGSDSDVSDDSSDTEMNLDTSFVDSTGSIDQLPDYPIELSIEFGVSNESGKKLKILEVQRETGVEEPRPGEFDQVLDKNGKLVPIVYKYLTHETEENNHRDTPYNFENIGGNLFEVEGEIDPWKTAVVFRPKFWEERELLHPIANTYSPLMREDAGRIEEAKGMYIEKTEDLGTYPNGYSFHFIQFEQKDTNALVSFVMKDDEANLIYLDFPAVYDEISTWRVDDGGVFDFDMFILRAVILGPNGIEIITDWYGAEGTNTWYMSILEGEFVQDRATYLYQAPL